MVPISWFTLILGAIFTAILIAIRYFYKKTQYWHERSVTSLSLWDIIRSTLLFPLQDVVNFELELYKKYGRTYGNFPFFEPSLTISDPELIKQICVKDFHLFHSRRTFATGADEFDKMVSLMPGGEDWKRVRSVMSPTFSSGKMRKMSRLMLQCIKHLEKNIEQAAMNKTTFDVKKCFGAFTMDVIASCAFGTKIESCENPDNPFAKNASVLFDPDQMGRLNLLKFAIHMASPKLGKLMGLKFPVPVVAKAIKFFSDVIEEVIKGRQNMTEKPVDFLQLVLDAQKNEENEENEIEEETSQYGVGEEGMHKMFNITAKQKKLSRSELLAQTLLFFMVGYETTAVLLSCIAYQLALHPEIQEKLCHEVDTAVQSHDVVDYDVIYKMEYLDRVVSETLRIQPPLVRLERKSEVDYKLGDTGITVPKGVIVGIPVLGIHMDPEFYPDPEIFNPDRFLPEEKERRNPYTFLPFGAGPRNCIAMRFALMEAKMGIVHILKNYQFTRHPETKVPMEFKPGSGLISPKDLKLGAERRDLMPLL